MKKMLLKKKKRLSIKLFLIVVMLIIITVFILFIKLGNVVNSLIFNLSEIEVKRLSKIILNESINKTLLDYSEANDLLIVSKSENGNIKEIDMDSAKANKMLLLINSNINTYIKELESGKSSLIDIKNSLTTNKRIFSNKPGVIFEIPLGLVTNNSVLSNLGPKIPIRVYFNGELKSQLKTEIEKYGINNVLIKLIVNVEMSEQIVMPLISREVSFDTDILVAMKMIQGDIPNYYITGTN